MKSMKFRIIFEDMFDFLYNTYEWNEGSFIKHKGFIKPIYICINPVGFMLSTIQKNYPNLYHVYNVIHSRIYIKSLFLRNKVNLFNPLIKNFLVEKLLHISIYLLILLFIFFTYFLFYEIHNMLNTINMLNLYEIKYSNLHNIDFKFENNYENINEYKTFNKTLNDLFGMFNSWDSKHYYYSHIKKDIVISNNVHINNFVNNCNKINEDQIYKQKYLEMLDIVTGIAYILKEYNYYDKYVVS
jgi:hypothetical protein